MAERRASLMEPRTENLLDRVDSKFTLVTLAAMRAREINDYYNQLGEGLGKIVPPQVTSVSRKPLTISLEEIEAGKIRAIPKPPEVDAEAEAEAALLTDAEEPDQASQAQATPPWPRRNVPIRSWPCADVTSCSASPAGSPPTRRSTSAVSSSTPARTSSPCSPTTPNVSSVH